MFKVYRTAHSIIFAALCFLFTTNVLAQPKQVILTGTMVVKTGEKFPYKIEFTESEGVVRGYAYTFSEPLQTKAVIKGTIDRFAHTLKFRETEIVSSHGVRTKAFMCLVHAQLEYTHGSYGSELYGPITSTDIDKAACTPGTIVFNNDEELRKLFASQEKFDTVISMKKKVTLTDAYPAGEQPPAKNEPLVTDQITAGIEKSYKWYTDTVILDIWDGGNIDGDRVSIQFNGKMLLTQHYLTKEKKRLLIPIRETGINTLEIIADNEGSDPPNTATLMLYDRETEYSVVAYNHKGHHAVINITRVYRR